MGLLSSHVSVCFHHTTFTLFFRVLVRILGSIINGALTADTVYFSNHSKNGVKMGGVLTVLNALYNPSGNVTGTAVSLGDEANLYGSFCGSLSLLHWTITDGAVVDGDVAVRIGGLLEGGAAQIQGQTTLSDGVILDGCVLRTGTLTSGQTLTLQNQAELHCDNSASLRGSIQSDGLIRCSGSLTVNNLTSTGLIRAAGDVIVSGTTSFSALTLDGTAAQHVGGQNFTVGEFLIQNSSGLPVQLDQTITVTGHYINPSSKVEGGAIREGFAEAENVTVDTSIPNGLNLSTPLVVRNCTLYIGGPLTAKNIVLQNAVLHVGGSITTDEIQMDASELETSGSVTVPKISMQQSSLVVGGYLSSNGQAAYNADGESSIKITKWLQAKSGTVTAGILEIRGDLFSGSATVTTGTLALAGDLYGSGRIDTQQLLLNGLTRQRISNSNLYTASFLLRNTSRGGVLLEQCVYYSDRIDLADGRLDREDYLVKEVS